MPVEPGQRLVLFDRVFGSINEPEAWFMLARQQPLASVDNLLSEIGDMVV
jgi:hypothetical protein